MDAKNKEKNYAWLVRLGNLRLNCWWDFFFIFYTMDETFIFHETQESLLCGQHCLNNLLQQSIFTTIDLSDIAIRLDAQERELITESDGRRSGMLVRLNLRRNNAHCS